MIKREGMGNDNGEYINNPSVLYPMSEGIKTVS
jgi:hypothetical protein